MAQVKLRALKDEPADLPAAEADVVEAGAEPVAEPVGVPVGAVRVWSLTITYTSPEASEETNILP